MSFLDQMSEDHRRTIVRLPYRVGLLISQSDKTGGQESDQRELQALSSILHGFTEDVFGSEVIQHIMSATIRERDDWKNWGSDLSSVANECRIAIDILREHADAKDGKAFKTHLIEIAEAVALAFREENSMSAFTAFGMYVRYMFTAPAKGRRRKGFGEFMNISANEHRALETITKALEAA